VTLYWNDGSLHSNVWNNVIASSLSQNWSIGSYAADQQIAYWVVAADTSGNTAECVHQSVVVRAAVIQPLITVGWTNDIATISVPAQLGYSYILEFKNSLSDTTWTPFQTIPGNDGNLTFTDAVATSPSRFYRIRIQ
jgi:hypothetical protein